LTKQACGLERILARSHTFTIATALQASQELVWEHASSFAGVNRELWPLARMTYPAAMKRLTPETVPLGRVAFRSWILLLGIVPVDFDDITLMELEPGRGFYEVSRLLTMREWRHRRTLTATADGCIVRDEIAFEPRWRWTGAVLAWVYRLAFRLRHRNLRRLFSPRSGAAFG
jgi:ligand-binding SRPBCC domain-containing protein